jgi:hypothetical protein
VVCKCRQEGGLVSPTEEGTPQGGPLSPLLSNLMRDVLDKELEKRGHHFVRYADDCNIYVRSQKAGERVATIQPVQPGRRIYPPPCEECVGSGTDTKGG